MRPSLTIPRPDLEARLEAQCAAPGLVTVLGPPGVGKTHLVRAFLNARRAELAERAWLCDLSDVTSVDGLVDRVATTVDVQQSTGLDLDLGHELGGRLSRLGRFALVLDNFEQLVDCGASLVAAWAARCSEGLFLVTSRQALRVRSERRLEVGTLTVEQAEQLFLLRVRAVAPDWDLDAMARPALHELLERLDRLPLAIELAAAQATLLSLGEMLSRLKQGAPLGESGFADADPRHRSLHAAIRWSWNLLDSHEQHAFAQLGVFRGGFTLEAAEAVVRLVDCSRPTVAVLHSLRDQSLIVRHASDAPARVHRFTLYQSLRDFAKARLTELGEMEAVRARHADYYLNAAMRWRMQAVGEDPLLAMQSLLGESANLEAVQEWAQAVDPARNGMALLVLSEVVFIRGGFERHAVRLRRALEQSLPSFLAGQLRVELGLVLFVAGRPREALRELRDTEPPGGLVVLDARWRVLMANVLRAVGRAPEAEGHLREGLARACAAGDRGAEAVVLCFLANHQWHMGELTESEQLFEEALRLSRAAPNPRNLSRTQAYLGLLRMEQGRFEEARGLLDAASASHAERGERPMVARVLLARALVELLDEQWAAGKRFVGDAHALSGRIGEGWVEAMSQSFECLVRVVRGELADAARSRDAAAPLVEALGDPTAIEAFAFADWLLERARRSPEQPMGRYASADWVDDSQGSQLPLRLLTELEHRVSRYLGIERGEDELADVLVVRFGPSCKWFERQGHARVSLRRRKSARAILELLVTVHRAEPERTLARRELRAVGWPGEAMRPDSAAKRVHVAIWTLRRLGLRDVIETVDGEYRLAQAVVVEGD